MNDLAVTLAPLAALEELVVGVGIALVCLAVAGILLMVGGYIARRGGGR